MNKISKWLMSYSSRTKTLLLSITGGHILYTLYVTKGYGYIADQYGIDAYLGRVIGTFLGMFLPTLIISSVITLIPYLIFRKKAKKYKRFLDYLAIVFLIISILLIYSALKFPMPNTIR